MDGTNRLAKILVGRSKKTKAYDTVATILKVENSTAWVHIPGGVGKTPVKLSVDAKIGDTVQVRVANGKAWITGNHTAPPTDDTKATKAQEMAKYASKSATDYITDTTGNGIWITPPDKGPQSGNVGKNTTGWHIADVLELFKSGISVIKAWMDDNTAKIRVGREDSGHTLLSANGMKVYGGDGSQELAHIGYGEGNSQSGTAEAPYYVLGNRRAGVVGNWSFMAGVDNKATAYNSAVFGKGNEVTQPNGFACGEHSDPSDSGLFAVGNGFDENDLHNAFYIEGSFGDTYASGDFIALKDYNNGNGYTCYNTRSIRRGDFAITATAGSIVTKNITFSPGFNTTPVIIAGLHSSSTSTKMALVQVTVSNESASGFTVRVYNDGTSDREPRIHWIAVE